MIALVLLSAVVVLGIATSLGWTSRRWPRFFSQTLHRDLSLFCLVLIVVHVATTVVDGFAPIGFLDAVIPLRSPYRPLWLGLGALAFDLFLVLGVTSALRRRVGYRSWKAVHWLAYLCWPVAVLHGLGTGTDARLAPTLVIDVVCVAAVVVALGYRLAAGWPNHATRRALGGGAASAFCLGLAVFAFSGPLRPDWSKQAGTPTALLSGSSGSGSSGSSAAARAPSSAQGGGQPAPPGGVLPSPPLPGSPFTASLAGVFTTSPPDAAGQITVDIRGQLSGGIDLPCELVLRGTKDGDGVRLMSSQVTVGAGTGNVVSLDGNQVVVVVRSGTSALHVTMQLGLDRGSGRVKGVATATPG
jgi:DMSO/TMAO reductase YedYZ heme-binding membrane subunit